MAIDEAMRHRIHGRLGELLGHDEAAALMSALPLDDRLDRWGDRLSAQMPAMDERLTRQMTAMDERLTRQMTAMDERLTARMTAMDERLGHRIDALDVKIDGVEERLSLKIDVAVERARAETSREARFALLASFGVIAAAASAVLSAIGFFG